MSGDATRERKLAEMRKLSAKIRAASEVPAIPMDVETFPMEEDTKDFRESVTENCVARLRPDIDEAALKSLVALYMRPVGKVPVDAGLPAHPIHEVLGWYNFEEKKKTMIAPYFAFRLMSTGEVFLRPMRAANRPWAFKTARDDRTPHSEAEAQYIEAARIATERDTGVTLDIYRQFRELVCDVERDGETVKVPVCDSNTLTRFATERSSSKRRDGEPMHTEEFAVPPSDGAIDVASAASLDPFVVNDVDAGGASAANVAPAFHSALLTLFKHVQRLPDAPRPVEREKRPAPVETKPKPAPAKTEKSQPAAEPVPAKKASRVVKTPPAPSFAKKFEAPAQADPPKPKEVKTNGSRVVSNGTKKTTAPLKPHAQPDPVQTVPAGTTMMLRTEGLIVEIASASLARTTADALAPRTRVQELVGIDDVNTLFSKLDELFGAKASAMLAILLYFVVPAKGASKVYPTGQRRVLFDTAAKAMTGIPPMRVAEAGMHKLESFATREMLKDFLGTHDLAGDLLMLVHLFFHETETVAGTTDPFIDLI